MVRLCWRVALLAIAASIYSFQAKASPIVYTFTTTATGTLGGTAFTDAPLVVTLAGDTSGITAGPSPYTDFLINPGNATLIIGGLGAATLTDPMVVASTYNGNLDGSDAVLVVDNAPGNGTGLVLSTGSVFLGYNLGSFGPISGDGGLANGGGSGNIFPTSAGVLEFPRVQPPSSVASTFTAVATQNVTGLPGGPTSAPVYLAGGNAIGEISGTISSPGDQDYYWFSWGGGAFSATASVTGAASGASYVFSAGAAGSCNSVGNERLNIGDGFSGTISDGNLAAGQYCIGLDADVAPNFSLTFNTPVSGVPEPGTFVLLSGGLAAIAIARRAARRRTR